MEISQYIDNKLTKMSKKFKTNVDIISWSHQIAEDIYEDDFICIEVHFVNKNLKVHTKDICRIINFNYWLMKYNKRTHNSYVITYSVEKD